MGELIMLLLHSATNAHVHHLKSRSYAQHVALQEFYEGLRDFADTLAEVYQGKYGLIESYPPRYTFVAEPMALVTGVAEWVEENRDECCGEDDKDIQNIIDELLAHCSKTAYKLKFLK